MMEPEEERLRQLVFGAEDELVEKLEESDEEQAEESSSDSEEENESRLQLPAKRKAAWEDEDDAEEEEIDMTHRFRKDFKKSDAESKMSKQKLQERLKEQFQRAMGGTPSWAEKSVKKSKKKGDDDDDEEEDEDDEDGELLKKTGNYVGSSESLPKGIIKLKKCLNANSENPSEDRLTTVQFHPSAQVVMTAGLDHTISLFQVDGKTNPKIQSIHLERFPVNKASFSANGEQVVATGMKNKLFYIYDMIEGKVIPVPRVRGLDEQRVKEFEVSPDGEFLLLTGSSGYLHLMTMKTREVVRSMKINGNVCATGFTGDGSKIFSNSDEGEVYIWDVKSSKCMNRFVDEGCVRGTSLAVSRDGLYVACGSQSGVVNIYSQKTCLQESSPKPLKAVMNLLTAATSLRFNPNSEILAIASRAEDEANRLVHIPSFTVFSNFPLFRKKTIYRSHCLDFSPNSGFYSVANNKGHAVLFRLLHYKDF
ncbi:U3 small nucleolar RNA-associated protein 18 homolog [Colossoma macropomum]|uniref:U3 small nucleolar RNA-associated protein 18 homolog n=1 Tax=Colossoma macropomum TaxID=42526 RepID=UPI0018640D4F|nr:U3 small nucleolar RNA-associated protein 18 homolog [Colossoma macropomum]